MKIRMRQQSFYIDKKGNIQITTGWGEKEEVDIRREICMSLFCALVILCIILISQFLIMSVVFLLFINWLTVKGRKCERVGI